MGYVIGTGWWCDGGGKKAWSVQSSDKIRQVGFFDKWHAAVVKYTNPLKIVAVDSCSPVKPDFAGKGVEVITMTRNFNQGAYGFKRGVATRQVFMGAWYAFFNDADYFVWIEQDCLIRGAGIVERAIESMGSADYAMARWDHQYEVETCFMVFRCGSVPRLWSSLMEGTEEFPELRYWGMRNRMELSLLPFGYGRNRPIVWGDEHAFAQQMNEEELSEYDVLEGYAERHCPLCGKDFSDFEPLPEVWRRPFWRSDEGRRLRRLPFVTKPNRACPFCKSHERHRSQYMYLLENLPVDARVLEIGPDGHAGKALRHSRWTSVDLDPGKAGSVCRDICDLGFEECFDVVICCHVLEHVERDDVALKSIRRSLVRGGWVLVQVPIWASRTVDGDAASSRAEKERLWGNPEHVRRYGPDFPDRMRAAGFKVEEFVVGEWKRHECERLGLDPAEILYKGVK